ncbi:methionyl-tRNA formyltransferase [Bifidobacterium sp. SO4]|uniref:methionyl-tRNA formyltransferase n=1 Tax=Bifidobacterium sp. SO4 TaxID=2809030 RepID=UPI001BDCD94E|nr:methionyl-tRNA formyltransferase [Bifidobacterium sp. SO4]MBT1170099.1 methionyl-tRNA formyltransferase [Bifidobacterium sp. SO4]
MLRLVFAGTPDVAVPSLKAFAADPRFEVVGVITRPDAPTGRGRKLMPSPVKATATELGLPVIDSKPRSPEFLEALDGLNADIAAVIAYGNILPKNVLDAVPMGWYNLHFSNLPKWRGAAPAQRAIWAGDATTGADVFKVGEGLDDGPIVASMTVELTGRETSGELLDRLAEEGAPMYVDALAAVGDGTATFTPQPAEGLEYAHKITVEDARIDWTDSAEAIDRQIRACTPHPGAWTKLYAEGLPSTADTTDEADATATAETDADKSAKSITLHVLAAQPADADNPNAPTNLKPGELKVGKKNVWVGTGTGALELTQVKAQGKKAMRAADWARGARLAADACVR